MESRGTGEGESKVGEHVTDGVPGEGEGGVEEWKRQSSNMGDIKRNGRKEKERRRDRGVR